MKARAGTKIASSGKSVATRISTSRRRRKAESSPTEEPFIENNSSPPPRASGDASTAEPVHLEVTHPAARRVCIAGSFNDWQAAEMIRLGGDKWAIDLALPPGSYEYRLVVDGHWMADPNATHTVPNPFGEPNSLLVVPAAGKGLAVTGRPRCVERQP